jgi:FkbM family methyltransferase
MKTFRKIVKKLVMSVGLLPIFTLSRELCFGVIASVVLLPLQFLGAFMQLYIQICWIINSNFKAPRDYFVNFVRSLKYSVRHETGGKSFNFTFFTPNSVCQFRAESFSTKEPETLEWMDQYGSGGLLLDVGSNVGIYSVYYAKTQSATVIAFEPSVFNLPVLVRNIYENKLEDKISIITNPLTNYCGFADFKLPSDKEGGALNGFGVDYSHDGGPLKSNISYATLGFSLDQLLGMGVFKEHPRLVKIDVDGIEHLILDGGRKVLSNPSCVSVLIEINGGFKLQVEKIAIILTECGFVFKYKKRASMFDANGVDNGTYNHVWSKIG